MAKKKKKNVPARRKQLFAREYVIDRNGTAAAIRAGYAPGKENANAAVQASRLLHDPEVREAIKAADDELVNMRGLYRDSILNRLMEIYDRCMQAVPVQIWDKEKKEYVDSGIWQFNAKGALRALDQISGMLGLKDSSVTLKAGSGLEEYLKGLGNEREF